VVGTIGETQDLARRLLLGMDQNRIRSGRMIGLGAQQSLVKPVAGNERFGACDDHEVVVALAIFSGLDAPAKLFDVGKRLPLADEGIGLREELVLDADAGDSAFAQLAHQTSDVVEIAVPAIAVDEDRQRRRFGHELQHLEQLCPRRFIAVAQAEAGGYR
jgi:hypothetical protein